ncbi:MAG: NADH-quinone oxidoreductase subunit C [bacterium]|nr:NADH-quinone oxidoreductase subunit C [bacterium]
MIMDELEKEIRGKFEVLSWLPHSPRRVYIEIDRKKITDMAHFLYEEKGMRLSTVTGTDTRRGVELLYHFSLDSFGVIYSIRVIVPKDELKIDSLATFLPAANWIEREIHELLGVNFEGHPNLKPLLTAEEWQSSRYPLRRGE